VLAQHEQHTQGLRTQFDRPPVGTDQLGAREVERAAFADRPACAGRGCQTRVAMHVSMQPNHTLLAATLLAGRRRCHRRFSP